MKPDSRFQCQRCGRCCELFQPGCKFFKKDAASGKSECLVHGTDQKPQPCVKYPFKEDGTIREDQAEVCPEVARLLK
jgi:Fe-S-cluster containining protein